MKLQEEKESLQLDAALNQVSKLTHELTKAKEFEDALNGRSKQMKSITENLSQRFQIGADPRACIVPAWKKPVTFINDKGKDIPEKPQECCSRSMMKERDWNNIRRNIPRPTIMKVTPARDGILGEPPMQRRKQLRILQRILLDDRRRIFEDRLKIRRMVIDDSVVEELSTNCCADQYSNVMFQRNRPEASYCSQEKEQVQYV